MNLQIKSLYEDFFNYVIWDVIKNLFVGLPTDIPFKKLKNRICDIFVEGALYYKVDYSKITNHLKEYNIPDAILDYIR
jgi:hypothetical protein